LAESLWRRALALRESALGPSHSETLEVRDALEALLRRQGRPEKPTA
jgi:hypothetical protein